MLLPEKNGEIKKMGLAENAPYYMAYKEKLTA